MEETPQKLELILQYFGDFSQQQLAQFAALEALYKEWNSQINVISRKDIDSLYEKHVLHSLSIAASFEWIPGAEILDLGTGGGFPGIPLAIFFPEVKFHLADSIGKKLKVVDAVIAAIDLKNVTTEHTRAEEIRNRKFDAVVSRAVAPLNDLWRWSKPLIKKKTIASNTINGLVCLKGGDLAQEISDSKCRPRVIQLQDLFKEDFFKDKFLLHVSV
ncbi:MAG: 16S rRNA (guanine(527)-N(7))-methyltransferase RsmG [Chitinophagaceae bacterium]